MTNLSIFDKIKLFYEDALEGINTACHLFEYINTRKLNLFSTPISGKGNNSGRYCIL